MKLLLGTTNAGKSIEISAALRELKPEILTPADLGIIGDPDESFPTLRENALSKARFYFERSGQLPTLAEDTGLYVDALADELGVKTRRWGAGANSSDDEWLAFFLERMEREENRNAKFVCSLVYVDAAGRESVFEGESAGVITRGASETRLPGLPVSSCFLPEGFDRVFADLTHEEKNAISHRGRAIRKFMDSIKAISPT